MKSANVSIHTMSPGYLSVQPAKIASHVGIKTTPTKVVASGDGRSYPRSVAAATFRMSQNQRLIVNPLQAYLPTSTAKNLAKLPRTKLLKAIDKEPVEAKGLKLVHPPHLHHHLRKPQINQDLGEDRTESNVNVAPGAIRAIIQKSLMTGPTSTLVEWSACLGQIDQELSDFHYESFTYGGGMPLSM